MKKRSPLLVLVNCIWTCGIFAMLWFTQTKREMNERGEQLPPGWWQLVPFTSVIWQWRYAHALWRQTPRAHNRMRPVLAFLLMLFLPIVAAPIFQDIINAEVDTEGAEQLARARVVS